MLEAIKVTIKLARTANCHANLGSSTSILSDNAKKGYLFEAIKVTTKQTRTANFYADLGSSTPTKRQRKEGLPA